ncbi:hydroxyphenylacetyl-CoA thioesterase PaaI [Nocardioides insulae]|uniref:hydroxyphenylacetyl-CoA thioesterase PaaI n=1 Tax=Nocardioides insulae TaxID=394734 RepID=UPI00042614E8|nr:hydroxyphenylacetyl-CoA thioesterase PaaI [Nocardioides insulae]
MTPEPDPRAALSAEETARRCTEQMWGEDLASKSLGMEVRSCGPGTAVVSMTVRPDMVNGWEICHGGLIATLADSAFAVACNSRGTVTVAAGFEVTFLRPGRLGDVLVATAREVALSGRSGVYDVTVVREADGESVAVFRGRSRSTGRPNPGLG